MTVTRQALRSLFSRILRLLRSPQVTATVAGIAMVIAAVAWVQSGTASAKASHAASAEAGRAAEQSAATQAQVDRELDNRNLIFCRIIAGLSRRTVPLQTLYEGLGCPRLLPSAPAYLPPPPPLPTP